MALLSLTPARAYRRKTRTPPELAIKPPAIDTAGPRYGFEHMKSSRDPTELRSVSTLVRSPVASPAREKALHNQNSSLIDWKSHHPVPNTSKAVASGMWMGGEQPLPTRSTMVPYTKDAGMVMQKSPTSLPSVYREEGLLKDLSGMGPFNISMHQRIAMYDTRIGHGSGALATGRTVTTTRSHGRVSPINALRLGTSSSASSLGALPSTTSFRRQGPMSNQGADRSEQLLNRIGLSPELQSSTNLPMRGPPIEQPSQEPPQRPQQPLQPQPRPQPTLQHIQPVEHTQTQHNQMDRAVRYSNRMALEDLCDAAKREARALQQAGRHEEAALVFKSAQQFESLAVGLPSVAAASESPALASLLATGAYDGRGNDSTYFPSPKGPRQRLQPIPQHEEQQRMQRSGARSRRQELPIRRQREQEGSIETPLGRLPSNDLDEATMKRFDEKPPRGDLDRELKPKPRTTRRTALQGRKAVANKQQAKYAADLDVVARRGAEQLRKQALTLKRQGLSHDALTVMRAAHALDPTASPASVTRGKTEGKRRVTELKQRAVDLHRKGHTPEAITTMRMAKELQQTLSIISSPTAEDQDASDSGDDYDEIQGNEDEEDGTFDHYDDYVEQNEDNNPFISIEPVPRRNTSASSPKTRQTTSPKKGKAKKPPDYRVLAMKSQALQLHRQGKEQQALEMMRKAAHMEVNGFPSSPNKAVEARVEQSLNTVKLAEGSLDVVL